MFNKSFSFQEGAFNINFRSSVVKNTYSNKCFYICSGPTLDGMKLEDENNLIKKIISFSSENKKELIILPHRRDLNKNKKDYIFWDYIPNNYKTFEEFYTENKFDDCFFITMYSSAICSVNHEEKKYILKDFFTPKIPSDNFFLRIFGAKVDVNTVIKYMEDNLKNITILLPKDI